MKTCFRACFGKGCECVLSKRRLDVPVCGEGLAHGGGHGQSPCFPGLCREQLWPGPASIAGAPQPGAEGALGRQSTALCCQRSVALSCQQCAVRRNEPCFKKFEGQKMPALLLLLHFRSVLSYCNIITLHLHHPQRDISEFNTVILTSNSKSFTSQNLLLSLAW